MAVTYYVVVPFDLDGDGVLSPGEAREMPNPNAARRTAFSLSATHAGAVAFSRTGDPGTGEFQDAVVLEQFGQVDLEALSA